MKAVISKLRDHYQRIPLSPAESAVATFVACALVFSSGVRIVQHFGHSASTPIPAEFSRLDSEFVARRNASRSTESNGSPNVVYAASHANRKAPPVGGVNINAAHIDELCTLPSVGPAMAAKIIAFRQSTPFRRPEDLCRVHGIGPKKWERLKPLVRVE